MTGPRCWKRRSIIRDGDTLTVQEAGRLGRNLLAGLIVLSDLFQRGVAVEVRERRDGVPPWNFVEDA